MIKKRIEKLEKERPVAPAVPQPSRTLPRELTAEEFEALYAETMAEQQRQQSRSNGST